MSSDGLLTAPGLTNRAKKDDSDGPGAPLLGSGSGAAIESVVAASGTGWREVDATTVQEVCLLWALAWPLFFQTLANEIQLVITTALYGHLGETDLAAANDTTSMVWFVLVFVMGAQNALYTMAPQAVGAGSRRQVGVVLQVTLFWTVVVLGPLTTIACYFMGDGLVAFGMTNASDPVEQEAVRSFSHASAWWMMPYIVVTTVTTWLDAISVVQAPSFISALFAIAGVGLAWLLMYEGIEVSSDQEPGAGSEEGGFALAVPRLGLNGFAYASAVTYTLQGLVLYLWVFRYRKQHSHVWFGWQPKRVFHRGLNNRFIMLALPMMLQYALNSWTSTIFQLFMSRRSELYAAAYGVCSTYVSTGGSVSNALFMAVSTRVGNCLGEGDTHRAKRASVVGFIFAATAGAIISTLIFVFRRPLAHFYTPAESVSVLAIDAAPFVVLYYFTNSAVWGLWAVMQGQMRTCYPATVICIGMWLISVPLAYAAVTYDLGDRYLGGLNPLSTLWACCVIGEGITFVLMAGAIVFADWDKIAHEAIETATMGEDEEDYDSEGAKAVGAGGSVQ